MGNEIITQGSQKGAVLPKILFISGLSLIFVLKRFKRMLIHGIEWDKWPIVVTVPQCLFCEFIFS